jgi:hypothetical protein
MGTMESYGRTRSSKGDSQVDPFGFVILRINVYFNLLYSRRTLDHPFAFG